MATSKRGNTVFPSLVDALSQAADELAKVQIGETPQRVKKIRLLIEDASKRLALSAAKLDPIIRPSSIFDPTNPTTAGRIVALTLVSQDRFPLARVPVFYGSGVYALYYNGREGQDGWCPTYAPLSNTEHPIYVGKADPVYPAAKDPVEQGEKLAARLREHAKTIGKAKTTLNIDDFDCRFLIVQTGFQTTAERQLIEFFRPIWNSETKICFGMSKHGDSAEKRGNGRSPWHTMHPGVKWSDNEILLDQKPRDLIEDEIVAHLTSFAPYLDLEHIFAGFIQGMKQVSIPLSDQKINPDETDELDKLSEQPDVSQTVLDI